MKNIRPQKGPQEQFLSCDADIAVYGGAAGGGKSFALLLEPLHYITTVKGFGGVIFRRMSTQVRAEGGLWDQSEELYIYVGGTPKETTLEWDFAPFGNTLKFAHMEHEKNRLDWQGSQIPFIGFDELTHFTEKQFDYLLSRNRSMCGVMPYIRATCNPEPESWVKELVRWWLDEDGRYADQKKSGIVRWFIRSGNEKIWGDTKKELTDQYGEQCCPLSFTFIPSSVEDNKILLKKDPSYLAKLNQLPHIEKQQLLYGDWLSKRMAGNIFRGEWFNYVDITPKCKATVRFWDKAATVATDKNPDPDWTVGVKLGWLAGKFYVLDVIRLRGTPSTIEDTMLEAARQDGTATAIRWEEEGGSSGKESTYHLAKLLVGYNTGGVRPIKNKVERSKPVSSAAEHGLLHLVEASWNKQFIDELENFPQEGVHDDQVDALSGAFNYLTKGNTSFKASRYIMTR